MVETEGYAEEMWCADCWDGEEAVENDLSDDTKAGWLNFMALKDEDTVEAYSEALHRQNEGVPDTPDYSNW
jgi:hypothetical protein